MFGLYHKIAKNASILHKNIIKFTKEKEVRKIEEKKTIKISLSTVFLIIAILVIIVMVYYIYIEKTNSKKEIGTLETNAVEMQKTINNLQEKMDTISNTLNSNTTEKIENSKENDNSNKEEIKFSDDEIKKSLQNYLDLVGTKDGSFFGLLVKLGLCNDNDYNNANRTDDNFVKTNIKYSDYKEKMLNYVTEECFNQNFKNGYKEKDGVLYYLDGGATGSEFEVKDITMKGNSKTYIAEVYNINLDDSRELLNLEFHIEKNNNNKCVISYCK